MSNNFPLRTISYRRIVDLSHPIHPQIPLWTGDPAVELETIADIHSHGYYLRRFSMGEHSGTHMNAPNSFFPNSAGIDRYPPESLVVNAVVIDARSHAAQNSDYCLTVDHVLEWEKQNGVVSAGSTVILYTGWQAKWHEPTEFLNQDQQGIYHFPGFGGEVTQFLLEERAIAGVGIDTHGVDPGFDSAFTTNRLVLANQGIVLENLTNLDQLPAKGITLVIGILRLVGGSGSPVSVIALVG